MIDVPRLVYAQGQRGWHWRLTIPFAASCDVLARSAGYYPDEATCRAGSRHLTDLRGDRIQAIQSPDGSWAWRGYDPDGEVAFVSATTFRTARQCQLDIARLRQLVAAGMIHRAYQYDVGQKAWPRTATEATEE